MTQHRFHCLLSLLPRKLATSPSRLSRNHVFSQLYWYFHCPWDFQRPSKTIKIIVVLSNFKVLQKYQKTTPACTLDKFLTSFPEPYGCFGDASGRFWVSLGRARSQTHPWVNHFLETWARKESAKGAPGSKKTPQ